MICPKCHNEVKADAKFCNQCGFSLSEAARIENKPEIPSMICAKCGAQMKSGVKFCTKCGTAVNVVIPTAETNSSVPACENCGTELKEGTKFCIKCGTPVKKEFVSQVIETSAVTEELERPVSKKVQGTNKRTEKESRRRNYCRDCPYYAHFHRRHNRDFDVAERYPNAGIDCRKNGPIVRGTVFGGRG